MPRDEKTTSALSRALLLGATLGTIPLVQVGCAPQAISSPDRAAGALTEEELCGRALATRDPDVLDTLLRRYPTGSCVIPTLTAMPPQTLAQVSPAVLRNLPAPVRFRIPSSVAIHLRLPAQRDSFADSGRGPSS